MEQQTGIAKQLIDLQRITFDGMINNMILFWDQTGKMLGSFMDQASWMPDEGKRVVREWVDGNKRGCENFKTTVTDELGKMGTRRRCCRRR